MRLRSASVAVGTALLSLSLLATPASAAPGTVFLYGDGELVKQYDDPKPGKCHELPNVDGFPELRNATEGPIALFEGTDCQGFRGVAGPDKTVELEEVFSFVAMN